MPASTSSQTPLVIGVDVGGTFTDLVASDGERLMVVKVPSTPEGFERGVIEAVGRVEAAKRRSGETAMRKIVHGSTVATNALLQRAGERVAFITTSGFADMLLIGRQNRPRLYALRVERPAPITWDCFAVAERMDSAGRVVLPLDERAVEKVIAEIRRRGIFHVAVCLLFSFVNSAHERRVGEMCRAAGLTVSLSSDLLPEFREYERASTTAINASLRPTVEAYLRALEQGLATRRDLVHDEGPSPRPSPGAPGEGVRGELRIMHSSGGTLSPVEAAQQAARLVLSGPAGGIIGAAFVARAAGFEDVITYDMGGTSTDVATIVGGAPQWTTTSTIDGLPVALPMFDIHTVGAGGGSIAYVDTGGALRVGPRSAGAAPGPACYARGGTEPTVTDANLILGRILPDRFLGGAMTIRKDLAEAAIASLARQLGKSAVETARGIVKVAEGNMEGAIRAVTSRRGHDPSRFTLVSFGGAGGLHACAIAQSLDIGRVLIPPYAGVLSALGMVVAPPVAEASKTVVQLGDELDDARLAAEYGLVSGKTMDLISYDQTASAEAWADVRFKGQSHELKVRVMRPTLEEIRAEFLEAYERQYGRVPVGREVEVVTIRVRRIGRGVELELPRLERGGSGGPAVKSDHGRDAHATSIAPDGSEIRTPIYSREGLLAVGDVSGPLLLIDAEATAYVPAGWRFASQENGSVILSREDA
jgi:N-methylhydantoinase A